MNITELRNKRAALWNTMEGFLNTHRNDMGVLSAEDDATYSKMEAELDALTNEVKRMERRDAHEAELNKPMSEPLTAAPERRRRWIGSPAERRMHIRRTSVATCAARLCFTTCSPPARTWTADSLFRRILSTTS